MTYRVSAYQLVDRPRLIDRAGDAGTQFHNRLRYLIFRICTVPRSGGDGVIGLRRMRRLYIGLASPIFPSPLERWDSFRKATPSHSTASAAGRSEHEPTQQRDRYKATLCDCSPGRKSLPVLSALERHGPSRPSGAGLHSLAPKSTGCARPGASPWGIGDTLLFAATQELLS